MSQRCSSASVPVAETKPLSGGSPLMAAVVTQPGHRLQTSDFAAKRDRRAKMYGFDEIGRAHV